MTEMSMPVLSLDLRGLRHSSLFLGNMSRSQTQGISVVPAKAQDMQESLFKISKQLTADPKDDLTCMSESSQD